jgi:outer membrane biosynthesis protein TonB
VRPHTRGSTLNQPTAFNRFFFRSTTQARRSRQRMTPQLLGLENRQLLTGGPAQVQTMVQQVAFPQAYTNFNSTGTVPGFDPALGTLIAVDVVNSGSITSEFYTENLGSSPTTITGIVSGSLMASGPSATIPVGIPQVTQTFDAAAYDGTEDFSGASGKDFTPVVSSGTSALTITDPAALAGYVGNGPVTFTESANAIANASAPTSGSMAAGFNTQAAATITVVYHYIPNTPPPSSPQPQTASLVSPQGGSGSGGAGAFIAAATSTKSHHAVSQASLHHKAIPTHPAHHPVSNGHRRKPSPKTPNNPVQSTSPTPTTTPSPTPTTTPNNPVQSTSPTPTTIPNGTPTAAGVTHTVVYLRLFPAAIQQNGYSDQQVFSILTGSGLTAAQTNAIMGGQEIAILDTTDDVLAQNFVSSYKIPNVAQARYVISS